VSLTSETKAATTAPPPASGGTRAFLARYGVILAMVATFAAFSLLRPDAFFTAFMMKAILRDCAPLLIASLGITFVLVMNDYDLSIGGLTALLATTCVLLVSESYVGLPTPVAILATIALGGALALTNGILIAYINLPSFILTIAMGTVFTGVGLQLTGSGSIYQGIRRATSRSQAAGPSASPTRSTSRSPC
jgi:ribose/xylose/arabinose/galactoside ABC-type transport system permease subunit